MEQDIPQLEAALERDPGDVAARNRLEDAYIDAGRIDDLIAGFESFAARIEDAAAAEDAWLALALRIEKASDRIASARGAGEREKRRSAELLFAAGELFNLRLSRKDKAMLCYQKAFKADPGASRALGAARAIYVEQESWPMVVRLYELQLQVTRDQGRRVELLCDLGRVLAEELKKPDDAALAYREALELAPDRRDIEEALRYVASVQESWREIVARYDAEAEAATSDSLAASLHLRVAEILLKEAPDSDAIDEALRRCLARDPKNSKAASLAAGRAADRGDPAERQRILSAQLDGAGSKQERVESLVRLARLAASTGDEAEVTARYQAALALEPGLVEGLHHLKDVWGKAGRWDEVVALYDKALKLLRRGPDEARLLVELAEIHRVQGGDLDGAEKHYRRIKLNDARNPEMLAFYADYYRAAEDWRKLLATLATQQQEEADKDARVRIGYEMAAIAEEKLGTPEKAIDVWKGVARIDPGNEEARQALKRLFQATEKWNALLEYLKEEIGALAADAVTAKVSLYEEMVGIYRDRLHLDVMVINTFNAILQIDPANAAALDALADRYEKSNRWNDLVGTLQKKADGVGDDDERVALLHRIAGLWLERFSNQGKAIPAFERILEIRPDDREALAQLQELFKARRDWRRLLDVYETELDQLPPSRQAARIEDMAAIAQDRLKLPEKAIALWERRLDVTPDEVPEDAVRALDGLYQKTARWKELAALLRRHLEAAAEEQVRLDLHGRLAELYGERLARPDDAVRHWREVLALQAATGADDAASGGPAVAALTDLYRKRNDWDSLESLYAQRGDLRGLIKVFEAAAADTGEPYVRAQMVRRIAALALEVGDEARTITARERLLELEPGNPEVARDLIPTYRQQGRWLELIRMHEVLLGGEEDRLRRLELMDAIAKIHEQEQGDAAAAFRWCGKAFQESADDDVAAELMRLAEKTDHWEDLVLLSKDVVAGIDDPERQVRHYLRVGDVCMNRLAWVDDAIVQFRSALSADSECRPAIDALERLYARAERWDDLVEVLRRKADLATDGPERVRLLFQVGELLEDVLDRPGQAADAYTQVLDADGDDLAALSGLERLHERAEDWAAVAGVVERQLRLAQDDNTRVDRLARLGRLHEERLGEPGRALALYGEVLEARPGDERVVERLEAMVEAGAEDLAAARMLAPIYRRAERWDKLADALETALEGAPDVPARVADLKQVAELCRRRIGKPRRAFEALQRAVSLAPDDRSVWQEIEELTAELGAWDDLVRCFQLAVDGAALIGDDQRDLALRVARLLEERLGRPEAAAAEYERVLELDPDLAQAHDALESLYTRMGRWEDLVRTLERKALLAADDGERLTICLKVCDLLEEVLEDPKRSALAYAQVLGMDPGNLTALTALERLYTDAARWSDLADILRSQIAARQGTDEAGEARHRLGVVLATRLQEHEQAVETWREVLEAGPHPAAAADLEALMASPPESLVGPALVATFVRRITEVLEAAFERDKAWARLVPTLERRFELSDDPVEQVSLLRRIATLREVRADDPAGAAEALGRALLIEPDEHDVRRELERLAAAHDGWATYLDVLRDATDRAEGLDTRLDLLRRSAEVADAELGRASEAEALYRRLLEDAPGDPGALDALEAVLRTLGKHDAVVAVLEAKVEGAADVARIQALLHAKAELEEGVLDRPDDAIATYDRLLEHAPDDLAAITALERLLAEAGRWEDLIRVYRMRGDLQSAPEDLKETLGRIAAVYDEQLERWQDAVAVWMGVLDLDALDPRAAAELQRIYAREERWTDLLDALARQVGLRDDAGEQADLKLRIGELLVSRLHEPDRAIDAYQQVLDLRAGDSGARAGLERLLSTPGHRRRAAKVLEPLYEAGQEWGPLTDCLEVQVQESQHAAEQVELHLRVAELCTERISDPARAYRSLAAAFPQNHGDARVVDGLEALAGKLDRWDDLATLLRDGADQEPDGRVLLDLRLRTARVEHEEMRRFNAALDQYRLVLDLDPGSEKALDALESIYRATAQWNDLLAIYRTKADLSHTDKGRVAILLQMAKVRRDVLSDPDGAISLLREVLDIREDHPDALAGLTALFEQGARWADLEELLVRQIAFAGEGAGPAALLHRLGEIRADHLERPDLALDVFADVVAGSDAAHPPTVAALEKMLKAGTERARVAALLQPIYRQRHDWAGLVGTLRARRDTSDDPEVRVQTAKEIGRLLEEQLFDDREAYAILSEAFREAPEDRSLRADLERLAEQVAGWADLLATLSGALDDIGDQDVLVEVLGVLARTCDERLQDYAGARGFWQRVLASSPDDEDAIGALERLQTRMEDWQALVDLYHHKADRATDPAERVQIHFKICNVWEEVLDDPSQAVDTLRAVLDIEPGNRQAISGLERLNHHLKRWDDLAELLAMEIGLATTAVQRASLRHRLAELYEREMGRRADAVALLTDALDESPGHAASVKSLEKMFASYDAEGAADPHLRAPICTLLGAHYGRTEDWARLVKVHEAELADTDDVPSQVGLLRQIAGIQEDKQRDVRGAFATLARAFKLVYGDPEIRLHLERIAGTQKWWDRLVNAYLDGIEDVHDTELAKAMLCRLGEIFEEKLDHADNAVEVYRRCLVIQDDHGGALDALERLYGRTGRHEDLVEVLHRKAMLADEVLDRKELLYRICEIWEDVVGDRDKAIETYRAVREIDPDDLSAVEALERLHTVTGDWVALVDLFRETAEMAADPDERVRCWFEVARMSQEHLDDAEAAVDAYRAVLDVASGNTAALRALEDIYEAEARWPELLDALELALAAANTPEERARIQMRMGNLLLDHLDDAQRALETYRGVLEASPGHAGAVAALEGLLADERWRQAAAEALEPVYEEARAWDKLVRVLRIRADAARDPDDRVEVLRRAASILEERLSDPAGAFEVLAEALRLRPVAAALAEQVERLARAAGDVDALATLLGEVRSSTGDFEVDRNISMRLAPILDRDLRRPAAAIECYERLLDADPYHADSLAALDRLYGETERWDDLGRVLESRLGMTDAEAATGLRMRLGELREVRFQDTSGALDCYRQVVWDAPGHAPARAALERIGEVLEHRAAVVEVLEPVYRAAGEWRALLRLLDGKLDLIEAPIDRALLLQGSAEIAEEELSDAAEAFDRFARALRVHAGTRDALENLERLAASLARWQELSEVMDGAAERGDDVDTRRTLLLKSATVRRDRLSDLPGALSRFQAVLDIVHDDPDVLAELDDLYGRTGDARARADVALRRAEALVDAEERKPIYRAVAELAAGPLADPALAARALRRILDLDEQDDGAMDALERLYGTTGDNAALAETLELRAGRTVDGEQLLALHRRLAGLYGGLDRPADAARHHRAVLDLAPDEGETLRTLQALYERTGQHEALQEILLRRVSAEDDAGVRARLLKRLAALTEEAFEDPAGAADFLRQAREADAHDEEALEGLARLYAQLGQWQDLVEVLRTHADLAGTPERELPLLVRISEVAQEHLRDPELTAATLQRVLEVDPDNVEALGILYRTYGLQAEWERCLETLDRQIALLEARGAETRATTEPSVTTQRRAAAIHRRGELLADRLGRPADGLAAWQKAFELDPSLDDAADRLKRLYRDTGEWPALAQVLRGQAQAADDPKVRADLFKQLAHLAGTKLDAPEVAVDALEQARHLTPDDPDVTRPLVDAYVAAEHWSEARPLLDSLIDALRSRRKLKELHVYLHLRGVVAEETASPESALRDYEAAHELDATYLPNLLSLGGWYFRNEQWDNALKVFQTLLLHQSEIQDNARKAEVFWHLGRIRHALGDARRARDMFNRALMLVPEHVPSKEGLAALGD